MMNARRFAILASLAFLAPACGSGPAGARGPAGVVIDSITALPVVLRPGDSTTITVSAHDGAGGALTYDWTAAAGLLSSASGNPVTWTAPDNTGSILVSVTVTNSAGTAAVGSIALLVSVSPTGPIITSVTPSPILQGNTVLITGAGFGTVQGSSIVTFDLGAIAAVVYWTDTEIAVVVPPMAGGVVHVVVAGVQSSPLYVAAANLPVCSAGSNHVNPQIISDGAGGAIIVWEDTRSTKSVYAQRVNKSCVPQWAIDGVLISTYTGDQHHPQLVPDGAGGAIIVYESYTIAGAWDIYAQRVNSAGAVQWAPDGVPICSATGSQFSPQIVPDGAGGAVIAWQDQRAGLGSDDIYAQRVDSAGVVQWTADGVAVCAATGAQAFPQLCDDGLGGGAIVAWQDQRAGYGSDDIYAQRVNFAGVVQWAADGIPVCAAAAGQLNPQIAADGAGGAFLVWEDERNGNDEIFAQRVDGTGATQWTAGGISLTPSLISFELSPRLVSDGTGGMIVAWQSNRSGDLDIYAQRVDALGANLWTPGGVQVSAGADDQYQPRLVSDGSGGASIVWQDFSVSGDQNIWGQVLDATGTLLRGVGAPVSTAIHDQIAPAIAANGSGGAFIVWQDFRNGADFDLYISD